MPSITTSPDQPHSLAVGMVQLNSGDDVAANLDAALSGIDDAAAQGARLVVLPEVWTYLGPDAGQPAAAEQVPGPLTDRLAAKVRQHGIYLHAGSILERVEGEPRLFNTTLVFDPSGELIATYRKIHLFNVDLDTDTAYRESDTIAPGDEIVTFDLDGTTVGLTICYDLRFPELFRILALRGAEVIVLPAAFTMTTGKDHWETLIRARAIENGLYMVAVGQVGQHPPGLWCYGRSLVADPWGLVVAQAPDRVGVTVTELCLDDVARVRRQIPALANRRADRYRWPDEALAARPAD